MSQFNTIGDVWSYLDAIPKFQTSGDAAANFSLDNIRLFCEKMGNPQDQYPSIHVAGTNGKGTTCYLLEKIYADGGYKTGVFISPHLLKYNERVRVSGKDIPDEQILIFFQKHEALLEEIKLSYFEISTALAFWEFAQKKVDLAILETGLGGRLDSTNIVNPEVSVITSIGLDHQSILGDTLEEIAAEKAGIIKNSKPVIVGNVDEESLKVIKKAASGEKSKVLQAGDLKPGFEAGLVSLRGIEARMQTQFLEAVNKWNVACAWLTVQELKGRFPLTDDSMVQSIEAFKGAPGRFEKLHPRYEWYFSGSHNEQALISSLEAVRELEHPKEAVLVLSFMKDKLNKPLIERLKSFGKLYYVEQEGERAAKKEDISRLLAVEQLREPGYKTVFKELRTELVIFVGSFYFYSIIKRWVTNTF